MTTPFRVLEVARAVVDEINTLVARSRPRLLYSDQITDSAGSITANIREAMGRRLGPERNQFFRFALGSVEETDERVRGNAKQKRIPQRTYWRLHNRLVLIRRMLNALMRRL